MMFISRAAVNPSLDAADKTFCGFRYPASPRKPVICLSWQIPFDVYVSPVFCTPQEINVTPLWPRTG
jgi:hypothetical protein